MEEQFYLVWPVVVLALVWLFRRHGRDRRAIVVTIAVISVVSFATASTWSSTDPLAAYFSTPARAWELGLGAGVAAALLRIGRLPGGLLAGASWVGLAMVGVAALFFDEGTRVPGSRRSCRSWARRCCSAVVRRPPRGARSGCSALRRCAGSGDRSYSYYLWHWPALIIVAAAWRTPSGWSGLLVAGGALVASDLSYRFVENPFRTATFFKPTLRGIAALPGVGRAARRSSCGARHHQIVSELERAAGGDHHVELRGRRRRGGRASPTTRRSRSSRPRCWRRRTASRSRSPLKPDALSLVETDDPVAADLGDCEYFGIPDPMPLCPLGDPDGDKTMVLVGDSHMRHWIPALGKIAKQQGYRAYYFVLQGCTPALVQPVIAAQGRAGRGLRVLPRVDPAADRGAPPRPGGHVDRHPVRVRRRRRRARPKDNQEIAALIEQGMVDRIEAT